MADQTGGAIPEGAGRQPVRERLRRLRAAHDERRDAAERRQKELFLLRVTRRA